MIALVRHGETAPNAEGRVLGRDDPPLTERGRVQADCLASRLAAESPVAVVCSPLRRAVETANVVGAAADLPVRIDARLVELDYGEWDGRRIDEMSGALDRWRAQFPAFRTPGGEGLADVRARVESLAAELLAADGLVVAVSHVSPIKAAVAWALRANDDVSWRMHLSLASITRIASRDGQPYLLSFNDTGHLAGI